jgi:hypothetical protein
VTGEPAKEKETHTILNLTYKWKGVKINYHFFRSVFIMANNDCVITVGLLVTSNSGLSFSLHGSKLSTQKSGVCYADGLL